jgi:hypothetical protein
MHAKLERTHDGQALAVLRLALALIALTTGVARADAPATNPVVAATEAAATVRAATRSTERVRSTHRFGWDLARVEVPFGLGMAARYNPTPGIGFEVGAATAAISVEAHASMSLYLVSWWARSGISPFVRGGYHYLRFNALADRLLDTVGGGFRDDLAAQGSELRVEGMTLHGVSAVAGVSFLARRGGLVEIAVGRYYQLGRSRARSAEDGVVLHGVRLPIVSVSFGKMFDLRRSR